VGWDGMDIVARRGGWSFAANVSGMEFR